MKQLKKLPSTKNPTRLIYAGLAVWWLTKIIYQFIDGWHLVPIDGSAEWWFVYAGQLLFITGLFLHWISFKEILEVYRKQMIRVAKELLAQSDMHDGQQIESGACFFELNEKHKEATKQIKRLEAEVEFLKGQTKGYQRKSEQSDSFAKAMELLNGQLIESQKRLDKTIDSQDKTIKLLVKSMLETSKLSVSAATIQRLDLPEITLYPEGHEHN